VVGVRNPTDDVKHCAFEHIYTAKTEFDDIGHVFISEYSEPCGAVLVSGSGTAIECIDFETGMRVSKELDKAISIDGKCSDGKDFWIYDGLDLQMWTMEEGGIRKGDSVKLSGDVTGLFFQSARSIMHETNPPVLCNGKIAYNLATAEAIAIDGVIECAGNSLFVADEGLHFGSFPKGRSVRICEGDLIPLFVGNLYEEAWNYWAFFAQSPDFRCGFLVKVDGNAACLTKIDGFKGKIIDATMDPESEELLIYTDAETLRAGNLHLFESQVFSLDDTIYGAIDRQDDIPQGFML
jgi:hypothetical protein